MNNHREQDMGDNIWLMLFIRGMDRTLEHVCTLSVFSVLSAI